MLLPAAALGSTKLEPVDEASAVPGFLAFRTLLQAAVARRDLGAVLAALHPQVKLSFGGDAGLDAFHRLWRPQAPDSRLWETMASVLALGGTFGFDGSFTAPYVFSKWPQDVEAIDHVAVLAPDVPVREKPDASATAVGTLNFDVVALAEGATWQAEWVQVRLPNGTEGFVEKRLLRSPLDYRANFARIDGRWQLRFFVAGD